MSTPTPNTAVLSALMPGSALSVLAVSALGWAFLVWLAVDMAHPLAMLTMPPSAHWTLANALAITAMWAVMMAAMMLPSALPMVLTFVHLSLRGGRRGHAVAFVGAYLAVWLAFSVAAAAAQWALQSAGWISPMLASRSRGLTGALLLIAGLYQFTPLKQLCLTHCRAPLTFLIGQWRPGLAGAWGMGLRHGLSCLGCCWALMALLFVGGVMNLPWIAALAVAVAIEKLAPFGHSLGRLLGLGLLAAGVWRLASL